MFIPLFVHRLVAITHRLQKLKLKLIHLVLIFFLLLPKIGNLNVILYEIVFVLVMLVSVLYYILVVE